MSSISLAKGIMNYITPSGTNEAVTIEIDVSEQLLTHPDGTGYIWYKRPDGATYMLGDAALDGSVMSVALTDVEVENAGIAEVEAWWQDEAYLWKSPVYKLGIHQSFTTPSFLKEVNEEAETTLDEIRGALTDTIDARDLVLESKTTVETLGAEVTTAHGEIMEAKTFMEGVQAIAEAAQTAALNSSITAQTDKESAQAAAASAATALESIRTLMTNAQAAASAAQSYAASAASQANTVGRYDETYLTYVSQAQAYRDGAQQAQIVAVQARSDATSAMNTASEAATKAETAQGKAEKAKADVEEALAGLPTLDDTTTSETDTWSSSKIAGEIARLEALISALS